MPSPTPVKFDSNIFKILLQFKWRKLKGSSTWSLNNPSPKYYHAPLVEHVPYVENYWLRRSTYSFLQVFLWSKHIWISYFDIKTFANITMSSNFYPWDELFSLRKKKKKKNNVLLILKAMHLHKLMFRPNHFLSIKTGEIIGFVCFVFVFFKLKLTHLNQVLMYRQICRLFVCLFICLSFMTYPPLWVI